jgi:hypothetical protein
MVATFQQQRDQFAVDDNRAVTHAIESSSTIWVKPTTAPGRTGQPI